MLNKNPEGGIKKIWKQISKADYAGSRVIFSQVQKLVQRRVERCDESIWDD